MHGHARRGFGSPGGLSPAICLRTERSLAPELHARGILCEPDSREPWFICEAHAKDSSLDDTLKAFEKAVDITLDKTKDSTELMP